MDNISSAPKRLRESVSHNLLENLPTQTPRRSSFDSPFKIIQIIERKFEQQNENIKRLIEESESRLSTQINERMNTLSNDLKNIVERVDKLETVSGEIVALKSELQSLKTQIKTQENSLVASDLRINNVPFTIEENLYEIFNNICKTINTPVPSINSIYRLKNSNNKQKQTSPDAVIIVKLMSPYDKNFFLKSFSEFRKYNKSFNFILRDIGINSTSKFYINENLTQGNYRLLQTAIKLKKQNQLQSAFTIRGLVYVKLTATDMPKCILDENDFDQLFHLPFSENNELLQQET